jgi:hypothetical protein
MLARDSGHVFGIFFDSVYDRISSARAISYLCLGLSNTALCRSARARGSHHFRARAPSTKSFVSSPETKICSHIILQACDDPVEADCSDGFTPGGLRAEDTCAGAIRRER